MLNGASSLLCGCHSTVRVWVCSLVVRKEVPRSISKLHCKVGRIGVLPLQEEPWSILPLELFTSEHTQWYRLSPIVGAYKEHYCAHYPGPHLHCVNTDNQPLSLTHYVHKATNAEPQAPIHCSQAPGGHSSCTTRRYGSSPDPSPTFMSMHTQSPQLLKPDLSQPQEHPLSTCMSQRHWVTKLATVLWIYSHWGEGSAFNSASENGHPCIPAEFTQAALRKKHLWQTPPPPSLLH